ncbi:glycosyl transferase, group 1 family protein [Fibrella aestuarina BUZ 2]|uniref:Glycosyl transferase, group 1 family protein n=1 Tax=Fibrella aestuarina BUZ 2 TaxID=1166018 RepID=I0KEG6_9BACT|nr:glycosyltransferase [Fibrella aestuarina]CCH02519.1 glycosyl transferase, group 1 family protein [Fibrella aestuarina BUZ 2]
MKKILFFTPHGTLTGSEVLLWSFLKNFDRQQLQAALYCERSGPLLSSVPNDIASYTSPFLQGGLKGLTHKAVRQIGLYSHEKAILKMHRQVQPDCWYLNTILMFYLIPLAKKLGVKTVVHIHELNSIYEASSYEDMALAMQQADLVIGVTDKICKLARTMGATNVVRQKCLINPSREHVNLTRSRKLRESLGIAPNTFVWLMIGTPTHRKGFDFLPAIARHFQHQPCHFIWMGYTRYSGLTYLVEKQLAELSNVTLLTPQTTDYHNYIQLSDGFLLCSREDPFPLVMIEAASLAKPIVASEEVGAVEFIQPGMGELVSLSTPQHFIEAMQRVMDNPDTYDQTLLINESSEYSVDAQIGPWQEKILASWSPAPTASNAVACEV